MRFSPERTTDYGSGSGSKEAPLTGYPARIGDWKEIGDTKFIEENWGVGQIGDASFDARAGDLNHMFDFHRPKAGSLFLDPKTGARQFG